MRVDLHSVTLEEIDKVFDTIINEAHNMRDGYIHLITGIGVIKNRVLCLAKTYGYEITEEIGNSGALYLNLDEGEK